MQNTERIISSGTPVRKTMCVPATSAPIERVFSQRGPLMRPHRSSFSQGNLFMLTSLKCNKTLI